MASHPVFVSFGRIDADKVSSSYPPVPHPIHRKIPDKTDQAGRLRPANIQIPIRPDWFRFC